MSHEISGFMDTTLVQFTYEGKYEILLKNANSKDSIFLKENKLNSLFLPSGYYCISSKKNTDKKNIYIESGAIVILKIDCK